jgi:hypothetical protein
MSGVPSLVVCWLVVLGIKLVGTAVVGMPGDIRNRLVHSPRRASAIRVEKPEQCRRPIDRGAHHTQQRWVAQQSHFERNVILDFASDELVIRFQDGLRSFHALHEPSSLLNRRWLTFEPRRQGLS